MKADSRYSSEQRSALQAAIHAANATLAELWQGDGPKYFVSYVELNAQIPIADELVISAKDFITATAEIPEFKEPA